MAWPTTNNPRTEFVTLRLTKDEAADLDALRAATGQTRSQAVRAAVERAVTAHQRKTRKNARAVLCGTCKKPEHNGRHDH